jgi:hypothetical protein
MQVIKSLWLAKKFGVNIIYTFLHICVVKRILCNPVPISRQGEPVEPKPTILRFVVVTFPDVPLATRPFRSRNPVALPATVPVPIASVSVATRDSSVSQLRLAYAWFKLVVLHHDAVNDFW